MRRRLPAGLRWRLLLALVATSAVTLAATALVVLPPMQDRLRDQSADSLEAQVAAAQPKFQDVFEATRREAARPTATTPSPLGELAAELNSQSNARVMVLDDDGSRERSARAVPVRQRVLAPAAARAAARAARPAGRGRREVQREGDNVVVAMPLFSAAHDPTAVLVADRQLTEAAALVEQVRTRFLIAAVVGLARRRAARDRALLDAAAPARRACARSPCGSRARARTRRRRATTAATRSATSPAR